MQSLNSSWHKNGTEGRHPTVALVRVAPGTNTKPDPRDSIRYVRREVWHLLSILFRIPGTKWCGPGWRTDNAKSMGGYAGADRWVILF